jgi:hypothetical protein
LRLIGSSSIGITVTGYISHLRASKKGPAQPPQVQVSGPMVLQDYGPLVKYITIGGYNDRNLLEQKGYQEDYMSSLNVTIGAIYVSIGIIGGLYAYIIFLKPWKRTWLEVIAGSLIVAGGTITVQYVIYLHHGCVVPADLFHLLYVFATVGISQVYFQERKHREGHKRAKVKLVNNKES